MIATIAKTFTFDAAHHLPTCPPGHKCRRMHGHTYEVEVVLTGPVKEDGFVVDYEVIAEAWAPVHRLLDHNTLNDVPGLAIPSTEVLAGWILRELVDRTDLLMGEPDEDSNGRFNTTLVTHVRVRESSTTWCEVRTSATDCERAPWYPPARVRYEVRS